MYKLIIILLSFSYSYAESITIYATQSASYYASGCCSLSSIGYNNSNTLSAGNCLFWSQYDACERRQSYPIWSFNFLQLPSNATVVSVSFDAEALYDEWYDSYMALSSQTGEITIQMGSYLVNGGDWSIDGQTWTWWNQGLNINQELPVSEVELGIDSGQLNIAVHEYDATIINSGVNAPKLIVEYELLGDINGDSTVNIQDVILAVNLILSNGFNEPADLNSDSMVDILDIVQLVNIILN